MPISQSSKNKKILFVVTQGEQGGAQRYVYDLAMNLDRLGYDCLVVTGSEKLELRNKLEAGGVKIQLARHLVRGINPLQDLLAIWELKKIFQAVRPDIVHLNSSKAGFLGSLAGSLAGTKNIIFTAHGFHFLENQNPIIQTISFWLEKFASSFRRKIICVSEFDRQAALKARLCSAEKLIIIHNGIDLENFRLLPREQARKFFSTTYNLQLTTFLVGTVAHLYATKGLKYLIDAAREVTKKFPNAKFIVIGEGNQRQNLESRIKNYGLQDKIYLLGEIQEAAKYLSAFDIFVLPSIKEGFPYAILESLAAGVPIIATKVGGIPEIINEILIPPQNPSALSRAITNLLENPDLAKKLEINAKAKIKDFQLSKTIQKTQKIYEELLADSRA